MNAGEFCEPGAWRFKARPRARLWPVLGLLVAATVLANAEQGPDRTPAADNLFAKLRQADGPPLRSYRAHRRLEARNERFNAHGWLEVSTEFSVGDGLRWTVVAEGGSSYIRGKVLRKALEAEAETYRTGGQARAALTADNYQFGAASDSPGDTRSIPIEPRREDVLLMSGTLQTDRGWDLRSVSGRLAKNPSFWTRNVDVMRRYGRIHGVRVPLEMDSRASVRIVGPSTFRMTYSYDEINDEVVAGTQ